MLALGIHSMHENSLEIRERECGAGCGGVERCADRSWDDRGERGFNRGIWGTGLLCTGAPRLHIEQHRLAGVYVTDRRRLGVLLPDAGLREPEVSSSSADDQDERSCQMKRFHSRDRHVKYKAVVGKWQPGVYQIYIRKESTSL